MMKEELKKTLCELEERANKDIRKLLEKPDISPTEWKTVGDVVDIIKDVECAIKDSVTTAAMEEEYGEEWGQSERGYMYRPEMGESYGGRRRNSMGQYMSGGPRNTNSYMNGSSYHGEMNGAIANLRNLMNNANSEAERMMYQRFINEAEHDQYGR